MTITIIKTIPIEKVSQTEFNHYYFEKNRPLLVTNINRTMPLFNKWCFDYFKEIGETIYCQVGDDLANPTNITRKITIKEYVSLIESNEFCPYMIGWSYQKDKPLLDDDFFLPQFMPEDFINTLPRALQFRRRWIFFGKKGISSDLHVDCFSTSAWILMAKGIKTFRALSPLDHDKISMGTSLFDDEVLSKLHLQNVNVFECTLAPGTILFIPSGWIHQVRNEENTIMVTGAFSAETHVFRFYNNLHDQISKDVHECEEAFNKYANRIKIKYPILSDQTIDSIKESINFTKIKMNKLESKLSILNEILNQNN